MSVSLPRAYYGVDTVAVRDLGAAFLEGSLGSEVPAVLEQVPSWGDSLLNSALVSAVILLCVHTFHMPPYNVWIILVILSIISALTLLTRYALGGWKKLQII